MKQLLDKYGALFLIAVFIIIKLLTIHVRASDSNIYFYTAKEILEGKLLYKDIFFTNLPIVPYVASLYFLISKGNLLFYFATAFAEATVCAVLLYKIIQKSHTKKYAVMGVLTFLFSFIVLSTSQHQTGVFLTCLFILLSYFFYQKKRFVIVGIFVGLAILTKAYSLPLLASYTILLLMQNRNALLKFLLGFSATTTTILLPSLIFAFPDFYQDIFAYSLNRPQGLSKTTMFWFAIKHDPVITATLLCNIIWIKKRLFFGIFSLFSALFFLLYQDVYYLYLVVMIPILIVSIPSIIEDLISHFSVNKHVISTILVCSAFINIVVFFSGYQNLQNLNINEMTSTILRHNPPLLYGVNGITPAIALSSKKPLLNNAIDTNANIFNKGYLNANKMTDDLIKNHGLFITEGIYYPELGIDQPIYTTISDQEKIKKYCKNVSSFPFRSEGGSNIINFFQC